MEKEMSVFRKVEVNLRVAGNWRIPLSLYLEHGGEGITERTVLSLLEDTFDMDPKLNGEWYFCMEDRASISFIITGDDYPGDSPILMESPYVYSVNDLTLDEGEGA